MAIRKTTTVKKKVGPGGKTKKKIKTRRAKANPKATKKTNRYGF